MVPSGITFDIAPPVVAADPNRMDIAMFVGFLPLRAGAGAARQAVADRLMSQGWEGRADDSLIDVPVRVRSISEVEALWNTGGRLDRIARVRGMGLLRDVEIPADQGRMVVNLDGKDLIVDLTPGTMTRLQIRDALNAVLTGVEVSLPVEDVQGRAGLIFTRTADGPGALTVYTNEALGFPVARRDETGVTGCPTGAALRHFFAMGGREAIVVAMGDPANLFADEAALVAGLGRLIGGGYGAGALILADLDGAAIPGLPGAYPPRDPWHGLAHLHGLEDVSMVLMPDLAELVSTVPAIEPVPVMPVRPPETFTVCAAEPPVLYDGQAVPGEPSRAEAAGLILWARLADWAVAEIARITPEATLIAGAPLPSDQRPSAIADLIAAVNGNTMLTHAQLQIAAPWIVSRLNGDMPGGASNSEGALAGAIAAQTLAIGAWRTVAGTVLPYVTDLLGAHPSVTTDTTPSLCLIGRTQSGIQILSDRTANQETYAQGNIRRLMALILRAARHRGEASMFDANGPLMWRDVALSLTAILRNLHSVGALAGVIEENAFSVLCGPETMHQSDIDSGRVIAEVWFRPAHSLEQIQITFVARGGGALSAREAA